MTLQAIKWENNKLSILDQLELPLKSIYIDVKNVQDGWNVINKMQVRGAPAIAIVGCLSLAAQISDSNFNNKAMVLDLITDKLDYLVTARPTAINMANAAQELKAYVKKMNGDNGVTHDDMVSKTIEWCEKLLADDVSTNKKLGDLGAVSVMKNAPGGVGKVGVLTHCNTGSLATAGYGTALGVIRSLYRDGTLEHAYCTETRPYNQGCRLTAYELVFEGIPSTLICDSAAAWLMKNKSIHAVIVGADRVDIKGNTANKIGTFQLAVIAKHFSVPFFVCAPTTSIDANLDGQNMPIEERPSREMTHVAGTQLAAPGINCWNPAFDVTPAELITGGIVTELGVFKGNELKSVLHKH